jgi:hypothetical protein
MYDVALVILRIKPQKAMRIGPKPLGYCSFDGDLFRSVVGGGAMVREQRNGNHQEPEENRKEFISHGIPPNSSGELHAPAWPGRSE